MARKFGNGIDLQGTKGVGFGDPSNPGDAVNLQFLMNFVNGLRFKVPVRASTTGPINLASPGASFDGVALATGDRLLVRHQANHADDGIYVWNGATSPLTRALDADTGAELQSAVVVVSEGTATDSAGDLLNADRAWLQRVDNITVGTTAQQWIPLPGKGATYTAGDGLGLAGVTFSVQAVAGGGIVVAAGGVSVDANIVSRHKEQNTGDGAATSLTITHGLKRRPLPVTLMNVATGALEDTDVTFVDDDTVRLTFAAAPGTNAYRVSVG